MDASCTDLGSVTEEGGVLERVHGRCVAGVVQSDVLASKNLEKRMAPIV